VHLSNSWPLLILDARVFLGTLFNYWFCLGTAPSCGQELDYGSGFYQACLGLVGFCCCCCCVFTNAMSNF